MKFIPTFPDRPVPEPCSLTDFVEGTGANTLVIEAVKKLFEVPNKPENPIEWFRLYFNRLLFETSSKTGSSGSSGSRENEEADIEDAESILKTELFELETKLLAAFEVEAQNKEIIGKLEHELKNVRMLSTKNYQKDNFRKDRNHPEDYHYRIRPDPSYQPSKSDMLLSDDEGVGGDNILADLGAQPPLLDSSMPPADSENGAQDGETYDDYPDLYFPPEKTMLEYVITDDAEEDEAGGIGTSEEEEEEMVYEPTNSGGTEGSYPGGE